MNNSKGNKERTNMQRKRLALTVIMAIVLAVGSAAAAAPESGWITTDGGVKVWLTGIEPGDTATWTGGRDTENYADGPGVLQSYKKGKLDTTFEGTLKKGRIQDGFGKYRGANGITYEGNFANGTRSGRGTMKWADGRIYEGDWANGCIAYSAAASMIHDIKSAGDVVRDIVKEADQVVLGVLAESGIGDHTVVNILEIHPAETLIRKVDLPERFTFFIDSVQLFDEILELFV